MSRVAHSGETVGASVVTREAEAEPPSSCLGSRRARNNFSAYTLVSSAVATAKLGSVTAFAVRRSRGGPLRLRHLVPTIRLWCALSPSFRPQPLKLKCLPHPQTLR